MLINEKEYRGLGMERSEKAVGYKHSRCNCCQAVLLSFADELGLDEETLMKIGACYGAGMGGMGATCGALCGAEIVQGMKLYEGRPMHRQSRELYSKFEEAAGATICKDLKGAETGVVLCSCDDCVRYAVKLVEKMDELTYQREMKRDNFIR